MKNIITLLFVFYSVSYSQNFWERTNGPYYGGNLIAINSNGHIFARTFDGIFRSTDNGDTWIKINGDIFPTCGAINSSQYIFVGTGDGVWRSTDNGDNWAEMNNGLTDGVYSLAINPS